jgi:putative Holliday junction resolvase
MKFLGVDLGTRRVGLAISDELGMIASPLKIIQVSSMEEAVEKVCAAADENDVKNIVVGHARNMDGKKGFKAKECEKFASLLQENKFTVKLWDERLSTVEAERHLIAADVSRKKRKEKLDAVAAQVILQNFLQARG